METGKLNIKLMPVDLPYLLNKGSTFLSFAHFTLSLIHDGVMIGRHIASALTTWRYICMLYSYNLSHDSHVHLDSNSDSCHHQVGTRGCPITDNHSP